MDRILPVMMFFIAVVFTSAARADVVLAPSPYTQSMQEGDDGYPESRFGEQPADPTTQKIDRRPSGFVFDDEMKSAQITRKATAATEMKSGDGSSPVPVMERARPAHLVPDSMKGVQEVAIIAGDLGFFPKTLFVTRDVPVRMYVTGASKNTLCIMMDTFAVQRQVRSNTIEEISFTPSMPGKYRFFCPINGMEGTLVVKDLMRSPAGQ